MKNHRLTDIILYCLACLMAIGGILSMYAFFRLEKHYTIIRIDGQLEIPPYLHNAKRLGESNLIVYAGDTLELRMEVKKSYSLGILSKKELKRRLELLKDTH